MSDYFYPRKETKVEAVSLLTEQEIADRYIALREEGKTVLESMLTVMSEATGDQAAPPAIVKTTVEKLEADRSCLGAVSMNLYANATEYKSALAAEAELVSIDTWFAKLRLKYEVSALKTDDEAFTEMKATLDQKAVVTEK